MQIGTWNSTKHAVLFEEPLPNALSDSSLTGELEGRKFRIVYVEVQLHNSFLKKGLHSKYNFTLIIAWTSVSCLLMFTNKNYSMVRY